MAPRQISRTRRDDDHEPQPTESIFDVLGPDAGKRQTTKAKAELTVADLMTKLGEQNARIEQFERNAAMADTRLAPVTQPMVQIEAPKLNLEGLPDPVTDAKGYAATIAERTLQFQSAMQDYNTKRTAAATPASQGDPDALWEDFIEGYPAYAENESRIRFATAEVVQRLAKRGVDVQAYMYRHSDQMFKEITKEYDKTFGSPLDDNESDTEVQDTAPTRRRQRPTQRMDDDGDEGRTEGVMGGGDAPGQRQGPVTKQKGLIEDLQDIQRKTGYF